MTENIIVVKRFKSFILGFCWCGCGYEFSNIRLRGNILRMYKLNHHTKGIKITRAIKYSRTKNGKYWMIFIPDYFSANKRGYVREHIYFYQEYNKCCLLSWGVVHHIESVTDDYCNNMIWNLQGMISKQHQNLHHPKKDFSNYLCSNPKCPHPKKTKIKKNGQPLWLNDKKGGWLCNNCYENQRKKNKKKQIKPFTAPEMI